MISIIMPVWNGARFVDRAIASVIAQTSPEWELIIVDDGSTDDSLERAERWRELVNDHFGEEKIVVLTTGGSRSGSQIGRNMGVQRARFENLAHLDMDDLYFPKRIESVAPYLERFDLVFSPYEIFENEKVMLWDLGQLWERDSRASGSKVDRDPSFPAWARAVSQRTNLSVQLGVAHRRQIFEEAGGFQPGILAGSEAVLWRRMIDRGARVGYCPVIAGRYNVRSDSQARTRLPYSTGGFEVQKDHPLGSNGQYLDAEWFVALDKKRKNFSGSTGS